MLLVLCMNRIQWWRGMWRGRTIHVLFFTAHNAICAYITHILLVSISWSFSSDSTGTRVQMWSQDLAILYIYIHMYAIFWHARSKIAIRIYNTYLITKVQLYYECTPVCIHMQHRKIVCFKQTQYFDHSPKFLI